MHHRSSIPRRPHVAPAALLLALAFAFACGDDAGDAPPEAATADAAAELTTDDVDLLRALGYVDTVEQEDEALELEMSAPDLARTQPGLTFYTRVTGCSAHLIDLAGRERHAWSLEPCDVWGNAILLPDGAVLAVHHDPYESDTAEAIAAARRLVKVGWNDELVWSVRAPVHHDVDVMPSGNVATLTYEHRLIPEVHPTALARDHYLLELTPDGEILARTSLTDVFLASSDVVALQPVEPSNKEGVYEVDHLHSNSLEFLREPALAARDPLYAPTNVLLCFRHQDMVAIVDWKTKRVLWAWGQGETSGPHDATLLPSGNVLVFDNGLDRKWSRVIEVDPRTDEIVWEYHGTPKKKFFTVTRGASQRLRNGNTLVTYSRTGAVFEVTPGGERVWGFREPRAEKGKPRSRIVRARRLADANPEAGERFEISD